MDRGLEVGSSIASAMEPGSAGAGAGRGFCTAGRGGLAELVAQVVRQRMQRAGTQRFRRCHLLSEGIVASGSGIEHTLEVASTGEWIRDSAGVLSEHACGHDGLVCEKEGGGRGRKGDKPCGWRIIRLGAKKSWIASRERTRGRATDIIEFA